MRKLLFTIVALLLFIVAYGQDSGKKVFDNSKIHEIRITFKQSNFWEQLTLNYDSTKVGERAPYLVADFKFDDMSMDSVGVRFKGFTSYPQDNDKKPFKIDFNEFVRGAKFDGLRKLNLNNSTGDASFQRDVICYDLMRQSGVKAPRTAFTRLYINDKYWGLYQLIEQVDKQFLKDNFDNPDGNLYKNLGWSHLEWKGEDPKEYNPPFALKTNEEEANWAGFVNLIKVLNNTSDTEFENTIENYFNVNGFLKTLAVDVATNNWDSYLEHGRNWYMYQDDKTGIFHWIPWDYNFALENKDDDAGGCDIAADYVAIQDGSTTVQFQNRSFTGQSSFALTWDFGNGQTSTETNPTHTFASEGTYEVCLTVKISDSCTEQSCREIDTKFSPTSCAGYATAQSQHSNVELIQEVISRQPACCDVWGEACSYTYTSLENGGEGEGREGGFQIDQRENKGVLIKRLLSIEKFRNRYYNYFCDLLQYNFTSERINPIVDYNAGLIYTAAEEDTHGYFDWLNFKEEISENGIKKLIAKRLVELRADLDTLYTCRAAQGAIAYHDIVINEIIASNDSSSTISDPHGEFEDWIELYNNSNEEKDLSGVYLSDNAEKLHKWKFPSGTTIPANGYLIVWADKDEDQNGIHASFKLSKSGETLYLTNADSSAIDSVSFGRQETNIAYARIPNGTGDFVTQAATHGYNNEQHSATKDPVITDSEFKLFPNPVRDILRVQLDNSRTIKFIEVISSTGQLVMREQFDASDISINTGQLISGLYVLRLTDSEGHFGNKIFTKVQ